MDQGATMTEIAAVCIDNRTFFPNLPAEDKTSRLGRCNPNDVAKSDLPNKRVDLQSFIKQRACAAFMGAKAALETREQRTRFLTNRTD
jgi:hypothetical protein